MFLFLRKFLTNPQQKLLHKLFLEEGVSDIIASNIIYLRTKPEACIGKISRKDLNNNEIITIDYLKELETMFKGLYDNSITGNSLLLENEPAETAPAVNTDQVEEIMKFVRSRKRKLPSFMRTYPTYPEIISIEGNFASGKTSLLKSISTWKNSHGRTKDIYILWDPMKEADYIETEDGSLSLASYTKPDKYGFMRLVSLITTYRNHLKCIIRDNPNTKYILCENSIYTIREALTNWLSHKQHLKPIEAQVLEELCNDPTLEWLNPTRMIYINTSPQICLDRITDYIERSESSEYNEHIEFYKQLTLLDITQYRESLKNILNLAEIMELDGNHTDQEIRESWVNLIIQSLPRL
jgi:thymidylate kinase